jgi:hypothetical protein
MKDRERQEGRDSHVTVHGAEPLSKSVQRLAEAVGVGVDLGLGISSPGMFT